MLLKGKRFNSILLILLSAVLLWAAWPASGIAPLLFLALVPLLIFEDQALKAQQEGRKPKFFLVSYLGFVVFNLLTTWWVYFASPFGMAGAVLANALLMTFTFWFFHLTRKNFGNGIGYVSLPVYWMAFEYFHMDWDLTWPWLNLGNGFAAWADMVQWYEYTGTQGGTLWIWLSNILLFKWLYAAPERNRKILISWSILIAAPIIISYSILQSYTEKTNPVEVVVVQPNIDPYNEKFSGNSREQLEKILNLAQPLITQETKLIVCPETALPNGIWDEELNTHPQIERIRQFIRPYPNVRFLTGLSYYYYYKQGEKLSLTARPLQRQEGFFDAYNAGMQISNNQQIQLHYKSRLVPGVEKMPFPAIFGYLENFAIDLGGTTGSLGVSEYPAVFTGDSIQAAPVICYESIYGDYVGEYVRRGANIICIMTNDGWWSDTPGYRQHCQYARLRAIEHRRSIARSANTGISCFIDQKGHIEQATGWWVPAAINARLNLNNDLTFYARHGDLLGKTSFLSAGFFLGITLLASILRRKKK
jgi:apolipoprotein N-acyltransferase